MFVIQQNVLYKMNKVKERSGVLGGDTVSKIHLV